MSTPIYLITVTDHESSTDTIHAFASSPYEAKKSLLKLALFETGVLAKAKDSTFEQETPLFFGCKVAEEPEMGKSCFFVIHAEAGNNGHSLHVEEVRCVETGYVRTVPRTDRILLQTYRLQTVAPFDESKLKGEEPEEGGEKEE